MRNYRNILLILGGMLIAIHVSAAPVANILRNVLPEESTKYDIGTSTPNLWWNHFYAKYASSTQLTVGFLTATSTDATSTLMRTSIEVVDVSTTTATSTFANGIQLSSGCFRLPSGTCAGTGAGGSAPGGTGSELQYRIDDSTLGAVTNSAFTSGNGFLGIGTTTPSSFLSVAGNTYISGQYGLGYGTATSSHVLFDSNLIGFGSSTASTLTVNYAHAATSTILNNKQYAFSIATSTGQFASSSPIFVIDTTNNVPTTSIAFGGFSAGAGAFEYGGISGITSADALNTGLMSFDTDAGVLSWWDMPIATTTQRLPMSYTANLAGLPILTIFGFTNGPGASVSTTSVGIGTTTPYGMFNIASTSAHFVLTDTDAGTNQKHWNLISDSGMFSIASSSDIQNLPASRATSTPNTALQIATTGAFMINGTTTPFSKAAFTVNGNIRSTGRQPTVSSCGDAPTINGNNRSLHVTIAGGVFSACTVTFNTVEPFHNIPHCFANNRTSILLVQAVPTLTTVVLNVATTFGTSDVIDVICSDW